MKRLYLLRHAKSSWTDAGLADHDRPLAPRGRRAAKAIGRHLHKQGIEPELVLCSSATRARETLERLGLQGAEIEPELYGAGAVALLARLREVPTDVASVMLIGHNPGMQELALLLARAEPHVRELEVKFPTAALATLAIRGWRTLGAGTAELSASSGRASWSAVRTLACRQARRLAPAPCFSHALSVSDTESDAGPGRLAALRASARGWHSVQLAVIGFIGLCGVLQGGRPDNPMWLQVLAGVLALAALAIACVATVLVALVAWPLYGGRSGRSRTRLSSWSATAGGSSGGSR